MFNYFANAWFTKLNFIMYIIEKNKKYAGSLFLLLLITSFLSAHNGKKYRSEKNQMANLREIVEHANRASKKVFVEDFTGLN